jgi:hypothetical protein
MAGPAATGLQVQNLDETRTATMAVDLVSPAPRTQPVGIQLPSVAPGSAYNVYLPAESRLEADVYAAIIGSDRPVSAIARTEWQRSGGSALVNDARPGTSIVVPLAMCRFAGQTSYLTVQNTDRLAEASVLVGLFETGRLSAAASHIYPIAPGALIIVDPCSTDFGGAFAGRLGHAMVRSETPVVVQAVVNVETSPRAVYAYAGTHDAEGAEALLVPLVRNGYYGTTGIAVVSPFEDAEVTVEIIGSLGTCAGQRFTHGPVTLPAGASALFYQGNSALPITGASPLPIGCAGSAIVRSLGQPLLAVVNDALGNPAAPDSAAAYNAFTPDETSRRYAVPLYRKEHTAMRLSTGIQVMNAGAGVATVDIQFFEATSMRVVSGAACGGLCSARIAPSESATWYPPAIPALAPGKYGAAHIVSDEPVAVVVNDASANLGMDNAIYRAIALPPPPSAP